MKIEVKYQKLINLDLQGKLELWIFSPKYLVLYDKLIKWSLPTLSKLKSFLFEKDMCMSWNYDEVNNDLELWAGDFCVGFLKQ